MKLKYSIIFFLFVILSLHTSIFALKIYTEFTYVINSHPDIFHYKGVVSVRGSDRMRQIHNGTSYNYDKYYPRYSKITYVVPYQSTKIKRVVSTGPNDTVIRKDTIIVYDTFIPNAPPTSVYWDIRLDDLFVNPGDLEPLYDEDLE